MEAWVWVKTIWPTSVSEADSFFLVRYRSYGTAWRSDHNGEIRLFGKQNEREEYHTAGAHLMC